MPDYPFQNPDLPMAERVDDLVSRLTLDEKIAQMMNASPAIDRLGIPPYNWWNECLHGVARAGLATVFPQAIGLAATWNTELMRRVGEIVSDEARAKHHEFARRGQRGIYKGLTFWTPNINIFRDPRWGRGQETYGEDPYLTARLAVAYITGLQGDDPRYLKVAACAKHYAVHSGPEFDRHRFDAEASPVDLRQTYLPAFQAAVQEAKVEIVMGAYNRTNGEPCCSHEYLLETVLRGEWGFDGHVVSDCGAIDDIYLYHRVVETAAEAAARAIKAGCDLECGQTYRALGEAVQRGLITEAEIDTAVRRLFRTRMRLGMFDSQTQVPYAQIPYAVVDSESHRAYALRAARESMVLLKNDGLLPLRKDLRTIAVIGPNADATQVLAGNYHGTASKSLTALEGIRNVVSASTSVIHTPGCTINGTSEEGFPLTLEYARRADVVVLVLGLTQEVEGEEGETVGVGDRRDLMLTGVQENLLKAVYAVGKPVVLVLLNGSALAVTWADAHIPAILEAWYPGQAAGQAIADVLFGDYNPAGRLPVTFYKSVEQLPPFEDYRMDGRTYRYLTDEPLYPFGYGLSFTRFQYTELQIEPASVQAGQSVEVRATVRNVGDGAGDEVVQLYVQDVEASYPVPLRQLAGFRRINLEPGEAQTVGFTLTPEQMSLVNEAGERLIEPGQFLVWVGGCQPEQGARSAGLLSRAFSVEG
jgi:beta-glucosidase